MGQVIQTTRWHVYVGGPLDCFDESTVTAGQWIGRWKADSVEYQRRTQRFEDALRAVSRHPWWEDRQRCDPVVIYDPLIDGVFFLFKIDNNGTTFLVSDYEKPEIETMTDFPFYFLSDMKTTVTLPSRVPV